MNWKTHHLLYLSQLQFILATSKGKESSQSKESLPGLKLKVDLSMTSNIRSLSSPSHPISFEFGEEPTQAQVLLGAEGATLQKDFILNVKLAKPHEYVPFPSLPLFLFL